MMTKGFFFLAALPNFISADGGGLRIAQESITVLEPERPTFANAFHVEFDEVTHGLNPFGKAVVNKGSFHYDFVNERQAWIHGKGQADNWCECANLKSDEECSVFATKELDEPDGAEYIIYKTLGKCCKLGTYAQGYGPLRPDWLPLSNATYMGSSVVGNRTCYEWAAGPPGDWFLMTSDDWAVDKDGIPCFYKDHFKWFPAKLGMKHILTFDSATYAVEEEADDAFSVPNGMDCSAACTGTQGWCKAR